MSREAVSRLERGQIDGLTIGTLRHIAGALEASVHIEIRWRGEQLDRLIDAAHAAMQDEVARVLTSLGWLLRTEVSFNHYGDRGRVDILAYHPSTGIVLVIEIKSRLGDLQDTIGRLDVKVRLGPMLARQVGWQTPAAVIPALVIGEGSSARRLVTAHSALFARYTLRGRAALTWIRRPSVVPNGVSGLLWYQAAASSNGGTARTGRVRERTLRDVVR